MDDLIKKEFMEITNAKSMAICDINDFPKEDVSFPLADLMSLGTVFSTITSAFGNVVGSTSGKVYYEAIFPVTGTLAKKDGLSLGTIINEKGIAGQARFKEVGSVAPTVSGASMVFMALAVMAINKSLKNISESQKSIISFLETEKQTQLKGDLIVLSDIIEEYQHNWTNEQYRSNREMQILDIKRTAEQNILFYREMIEKKTNKQSFIHIDTAKTLNDVLTKFRFYKLALYLYAFSSFLDIMLLENFETAYLESVAKKIEKYSMAYTEFYKQSIENIEKYVNTSLQSRALQGLSIASKFAGKQLAKIPDKDNKLKLDEQLISSGDKIEKINIDAIEKTMSSLSIVEDSGIKMFVDKINLINRLHNKSIRLVFDSEKLYLYSDKVAG